MIDRHRKSTTAKRALPSLAAALAIAASAAFGAQYTDYTPLYAEISITAPTEGQRWFPYEHHSLSCNAWAYDWDWNVDYSYAEEDSVTVYWTCSAGSFDNNDNIGFSLI